MNNTYFDSHCHLQLEPFDDERTAVVERCREAGVTSWIVVGTNAETSRKAIEFCQKFDGGYPAAGLHPHDADAITEQKERIEELVQEPSVVAVGETGLDFYKEYSPATQQEESLMTQIGIALDIEKPLIFHCRDAHDELVTVLEQNEDSFREVFPDGGAGVIHCFSGTPEHLEAYQDMGFFVSFSGIVTFPNADETRRAAEVADPDHLLVETDSPFLAPQKHRGKQNEPTYVPEIVEEIAQLQDEEPETIARITRENVRTLFDIEKE